SAALRHALGLLLVRRQQPEEGLAELERAAELEPASARFAYVYAVGLNSLGRSTEAVDYLGEATAAFPGDFDVHWALATMLRDLGRVDDARSVAAKLAAIYPGIPPLDNLLAQLGAGS
ncbi:MAG: tetratricopeptide repeat protein, partial [Gammaproteobacteria bacterium]|nr:tetratricopeptide repeat protein [Gammaproteobacteria bacterium]